jgi:hypothetical protein
MNQVLILGNLKLIALNRTCTASPSPGGCPADTHFRVRQDKVDASGTMTLRHDSRLHHIGIGWTHKGRPVKLLIADLEIRFSPPTQAS